jgi:hypothetical protein
MHEGGSSDLAAHSDCGGLRRRGLHHPHSRVALERDGRLCPPRKKLGHLGLNFWMDMGVVTRTILYALVAHLIEMALWAALFMICGEFADFATAYYHSAVNYTSLGYGDIIISPTWRLLGSLETADGMLLFGVSTAMIFAVFNGWLRRDMRSSRSEHRVKSRYLATARRRRVRRRPLGTTAYQSLCLIVDRGTQAK